MQIVLRNVAIAQIKTQPQSQKIRKIYRKDIIDHQIQGDDLPVLYFYCFLFLFGRHAVLSSNVFFRSFVSVLLHNLQPHTQLSHRFHSRNIQLCQTFVAVDPGDQVFPAAQGTGQYFRFSIPDPAFRQSNVMIAAAEFLKEGLSFPVQRDTFSLRWKFLKKCVFFFLHNKRIRKEWFFFQMPGTLIAAHPVTGECEDRACPIGITAA